MVKKRLNFNRDYTEDVLGLGKDFFSDDPVRDFINRYSPIPIEEAPKGLEPIGDSGLYATPDEPADPMDCDRYPNSIYCDGNPFTKTPIGIEPTIIIDECNIGIQFEPVLGFIKLPPVTLVYRFPSCREEEKENRDISKQKLPDRDNYIKPLSYNKISCREGAVGTILTHEEEYKESYGLDYPADHAYIIYRRLFRHISYTKITREILEVNHPYKVRYLHNENNDYIYFHMKVKVNYEQSTNIPIEGWTENLPEHQKALMRRSDSTKYSYINDIWMKKYDEGGHPARVTTSNTNIGVHNYGNLHADIDRGLSQILRCNDRGQYGYAPSKGDYDQPLVWEGVQYYDTYYFKHENTVLQFCDHTITIDPPPPPLIKKPPMQCCPEHTALLIALLKKVDKLSKIVGVDEYPASLPASLISKDEGFLGNLIPNANKEIPNLTQFLAWYVERFDEIMGQWEIPIEVKDSDPSKPGDQPLGVKLPNMAEAIAEMFTLIFQTNLNSEVLLNFAVRSAAELSADKQQNFITYKLLQSMTDWAGFKQKDIKLKMPLLFTLGKTRYDEILKETEVDVGVVDFDEKFGLESDLMRFREAAAILQANYKKKIDPNGDIKGQILKYLLDTFKATSKVNGEEDDFDKFLTDVELGFTNTSGVSDSTHPYGRDFSQRPKIKDLTKPEPSET